MKKNLRTHFLMSRVKTKLAGMSFHFNAIPTAELFYQQVFIAAAGANGILLPPLYPVGAAANYSLLYLLLRITTELGVDRVLEIGAGQSTLLLNSINKKLNDMKVVTLESEPSWADYISGKVSHRVVCSQLTAKIVRNERTLAFKDTSAIRGPFNLIVVDGPLGQLRKSRWAALDLLDQHLGQDFIVIFDDAGRKGEQETIAEFIKGKPELQYRFFYGAKAQCVFFTKLYSPLEHF